MNTLLFLTGDAASNFALDGNVVDFVVEGATKILGIMTTPPIGTFLTIGILGGVVGLVGTIIAMVKH